MRGTFAIRVGRERVHLRAHRAAFRRVVPNGAAKSDCPREVRALCGKWVRTGLAVRSDREPAPGADVCPRCVIEAEVPHG